MGHQGRSSGRLKCSNPNLLLLLFFLLFNIFFCSGAGLRDEPKALDPEKKAKKLKPGEKIVLPKIINFWNYDPKSKDPKDPKKSELGPSYWSTEYPHCKGKRQSPIPLKFDESNDYQWIDGFKPLQFDYRPTGARMINNGRVLRLEFPPGNGNTISGGPLEGEKYGLDYAMFHWGKTNAEGSEHTINGKRYPMEMHLIHHNKKYASFKKARDQENGLLTLVVLAKIGDKTGNPQIQNFLSQVGSVQKAYDEVIVKKRVNPRKILPDQAFWLKYDGSMTIPPCTETSTDIVLGMPISISQAQLNALRGLRSLKLDLSKIGSNYRGLQPLNGREVMVAFEPSYYKAIECGSKNRCKHGLCVDGKDNVNKGKPSCDCRGTPFFGEVCDKGRKAKAKLKYNPCFDSPKTFKDSHGYECVDYDRYGWCNDGEVGPKWEARWGPFLFYENANGVDAGEACCVCGGGQPNKTMEEPPYGPQEVCDGKCAPGTTCHKLLRQCVIDGAEPEYPKLSPAKPVIYDLKKDTEFIELQSGFIYPKDTSYYYDHPAQSLGPNTNKNRKRRYQQNLEEF